MNTGNSSNAASNPRKRPIAEADRSPTTANCTVVAVDYANIYYRVCARCETSLPNPTPNTPSPVCTYCRSKNALNPASKLLFRVLMSIATDTKVFVVILFDRAARVLFGCSADEFFEFAKTRPFAAGCAGKALEGEMLRVILSQPKNGNAQHLRVVSVVPLRSGFLPIITTLRELYQIKGG